ncbi:MAG: 5'-nucleotidase C-terminal domain-containing protein [Chromatiales bacterium]|nr:5'-nucleotidase C-terminal domain-containing protein [Chromatiales bacterium]
MAMRRRDFIKLAGAAAASGLLPGLALSKDGKPDPLFQLPMKGNVRLLHFTDVHGQILPTYFREPNVNLGVGDAYGRPPHIVGKQLLKEMGYAEGSPEAYAFTYLDFENAAKKYGPTGGFAHLKALLDLLREQAGGRQNTLTLDGGDSWQGSATSLWTRGVDMVETSNILGVDVMVGHWEFTYSQEQLLSNVALFKGDFVGQNVRVKESAMFGGDYMELVEKYNGLGLYSEDTGHAFQPYTIKEAGGARIAVIGQAFPRMANANPQEFFPDLSFGLREDDLIELAEKIREEDKPDAIVLLSHNGMDVDIKMAGRIPGLNAIFGGHTHDGVPRPVVVKNGDGEKCYVTNAGSNAKFVGVMDLDIADGELRGVHYNMVPVISNRLPADPQMSAYIQHMRSKVYDKEIKESRVPALYTNKERTGKTFDEILTEKLAIAGQTLYRRGNFMGSWDQVLCNALREEYDAHVALSAGVRWGTSVPKDHWITMDDVVNQSSMTYAETYVSEMTGKQLLDILEGVADNLFDPDPYLQSGGDMVRVGGLDYTIYPRKKLGERIEDARLDDGSPIDPDETYRVAGWAQVNRTPDGRLLWDITRDHILKHRDPKTKVYRLAKVNHPKLVGVTDDPGLADYPGEIA